MIKNDKIIPNPYDVLEVSPAASHAEIVKAFAMAMKKRSIILNKLPKLESS